MKIKQPIKYWSEKQSAYTQYAFTQLIIISGYHYLIHAVAISENDPFGNTIWALPASDSKILLRSIKNLSRTHHIVSVNDVKHQADKIKAMWSRIEGKSNRNSQAAALTLEEKLIEAINNEDYLTAAKLRDKINSNKNHLPNGQNENYNRQ
jgi:hypothetical protein